MTNEDSNNGSNGSPAIPAAVIEPVDYQAEIAKLKTENEELKAVQKTHDDRLSEERLKTASAAAHKQGDWVSSGAQELKLQRAIKEVGGPALRYGPVSKHQLNE